MSTSTQFATIGGIGTSNPQYVLTQADALKMFQDLTCVDQRQRRLAKALFEKANVEQRYICVPYQATYRWCSPDLVQQINAQGDSHDEVEYLSRAVDSLPALTPGASAGLTTGQRSRLYAHFAGDLAAESARAALRNANVEALSVTHLVTVSCTGFASPGVDIHLIKTLGLPATVQRTNVAFMGCHGAINGIRTANNIVKSDPQAVVLMTAVELCSLHCPFQWETEKIVGNALFADGSASLVLCHGESSAPSTSSSTISWEVIDCGSTLIPESESALSWNVGDHGFEMILTSAIGEHIEATLLDWITGWLSQRGVGLEQIEHWGVHPGGPRILSAVKNSLQLTDHQLATSMEVLKNFGNMSSPTVLFILNEFQKSLKASQQTDSGYGVLVAFGPGMIAEVALLKSIPVRNDA